MSGTDYNYDDQVHRLPHDSKLRLTCSRDNFSPTSSSHSPVWSQYLSHTLFSNRAKVRPPARITSEHINSDVGRT